MNNKESAGFTLVELLMVVSMLAVISLAIFSTFNNGIKIWQKVNKQFDSEEINIFFEKFTRDMSNTLNFSGFNFIGTENEVSFPGLVASEAFEKATIGKVIYSYDVAKRSIVRKQQDFSQIAADKEGAAQGALGDILSFKFQYYYYDTEKRGYFWLKEWNNRLAPLAVRIEFERINSGKNTDYQKSVFIPVGF